MKKQRILLVILSLAVACPLLAAKSQPALVKLLPNSKDAGLTAWKMVSGALQYAKGEKLTEIYNGGYGEYIEEGVIDAARNLYQHGQDYVEVTVHMMKSTKAAANFFAKQTKGYNPKSKTTTNDGVLAIDGEKGCAFTGKYYITATAMYDGEKAGKDAKLFLTTVLNKAAPRKAVPKK